jgi:hypothetical protein
MTPSEMLVIQYGQEKIDKAREITRDWPTNHVLCFDRKPSRVFYRDLASRKEISTDFTEEHIDIAAHRLPRGDSACIEWDSLNYEALGRKFAVYTFRRK